MITAAPAMLLTTLPMMTGVVGADSELDLFEPSVEAEVVDAPAPLAAAVPPPAIIAPESVEVGVEDEEYEEVNVEKEVHPAVDELEEAR